MDEPKPVSPDNKEPNTSNELLDQSYSDNQTETYVSPSGEPTTVAPLPTPLSLQKPKSHAGRWFLRGFVVLVIAALAAFGYWQWTEAQSANNEKASIQSALDAVKSANKTAGIIKEEDDLGGVPETLTTEEYQILAASDYACSLADFGCEKVSITVKKSQEMVDGKPGFAIVEIKNIRTDMNISSNVYLKSIDNRSWVVIYEGKVKPPADVVTKFAIPADFAE